MTRCAYAAVADHATFLARRGADYLLIVKRNQPNLYAGLPPFPGATCRWPMTSGNAAAPSGAPSSSPPSTPGWLSPPCPADSSWAMQTGDGNELNSTQIVEFCGNVDRQESVNGDTQG